LSAFIGKASTMPYELTLVVTSFNIELVGFD